VLIIVIRTASRTSVKAGVGAPSARYAIWPGTEMQYSSNRFLTLWSSVRRSAPLFEVWKIDGLVPNHLNHHPGQYLVRIGACERSMQVSKAAICACFSCSVKVFNT